MFLLWHLHFLLVDTSCDNVCVGFLIFFLVNISKDLDGILKSLWWVLEDLFQKLMETLFISSWSSFVAARIQELAVKFWRNFDELYQNWFYNFDALLMHFWCTFKTWCTFDAPLRLFYYMLMHFWWKCIKSASKVHQKCIKSASKVHQKCNKNASIFYENFVWKVTIFDQISKKEHAVSFK